MKKNYQVITFDAAGTLIRLARPVGGTYAAVAARMGYELDPVRLEHAFRKTWTSAPPLPMMSGPRPDDDRGWWCQLVIACLENAGYQLPQFGSYFEELYLEFAKPGIWSPCDGAMQLLDQLQKQSVRLGIISNFDRRLYTVLGNLDMLDYFESIIVSSEVGVDKPAKEIFEEALRRFHVTPDQLMHIGDEPEADGQGARNAGIDALIVAQGGLSSAYLTAIGAAASSAR
jgi:putative hydrolase of the HAD superfamily